MNPLRDHLISSLTWARQCTDDVLKDFPEDKATFRNADTDNHILWTLGHLALSDEWILNMITGQDSPLPESYSKMFGYESKSESSPDAYPPFAEVRGHFNEARTRLLKWLEAQSDAQLNEPIDDGGIGFAASALEAVGKEVWHEGWHTGQIAPLRRALGLNPAFGPPPPE